MASPSNLQFSPQPDQMLDDEKQLLLEQWAKEHPEQERPKQDEKKPLNLSVFEKAFEAKNKNIPPESTQKRPKEAGELNVAPFEKAFKNKELLETETRGDWLLRAAARTSKDAIASVGGSVGNMRDIAEFLSEALPEIPGREKRIESNPFLKYGQKFLKSVVPNTQDIDQFADEMTGGYTEPKTKGEKFGSEVVKAVVGRKIFGGSNRATPIGRAAVDIGVPLLGETAKETAGLFTKNPTKQEAAKLGTMVLMDMLVGVPYGSTPGYTRQLTSRARQQLSDPQRALSNTAPLRQTLVRQRQHLTVGGANAAYQPAINRIDEAIRMIDSGNMTREAAYRLRENISREVLGRGGYELERTAATEAARHQHQVRHALTTGLYRDARQNGYESFISADQAARNAYRVYSESNRLTNFIKKNYGRPFMSHAAVALFHSGKVGAAIGGAVAGAPIYQTMKIAERMMRSPELMALYAQTAKAAAQNNAPQMRSYLKKFDQKAKELEDKGEL